MISALTRHRPSLLVAMAAAATLPGAAMHVFGGERVDVGGELHFAFVAAAAGTAALASFALSVVGARRGDGRTVLLSTAFSTMAVLLFFHGLATPGVLVEMNGLVKLTGALSLPAGAAIMALTALPALRRPRDVRALRRLQLALGVAVGALALIGLLVPSSIPALPQTGTSAAIALLVLGCLFYAVLAHRALKTFGLTNRPRDLVVAVGCVWLAVALVPQLTMPFGTLGFYAGHAVELAGIGLIAIPAALDLRSTATASRPLVGDLSAAELVQEEEAYLGARVRALLVRLAEADQSTEQHTRRVALLAVQVGEQLKLPPATLRHLAVGGLLHDIGKLSVPSHILSKPAPLTDEEFAAIKRHPTAGVALLRELGGFAPEVEELVRSHHERLDGAGYPHGASGAELGIGPRILAVCDVYDALTDDRVYRAAWSPDRALALLREEAGTAFDASCVHALERVLGLRTHARRASTAPARPAMPRIATATAASGPGSSSESPRAV